MTEQDKNHQDEPVDKPDFAAVDARSIYFYYFVYRNGRRRETRIYHHVQKEPTITDPTDLITQMAKNAAADGYEWPPLGGSVQDLIRRRIGYIAVMVDSDDDELDSLPFELKEVDSSSSGHTFTVSRRVTVEISRTRTLVGGYCLNVLWDRLRGRRLDDGDYEQFNLYLNFKKGGGAFWPDSGGTNMGPPIPPP